MLPVEEMFSRWWKTVLSEYDLMDRYQTPTHPPTCANTHEATCSLASFSAFFLHRLISSPVCVLLLRGGVVYQTPGPGVWAHISNRPAEGMRCQKVSGCQPTIIHPSLFFLFFISHPLSSCLVAPHLSDITLMGHRTVALTLLGFRRLCAPPEWPLRACWISYKCVFSHPLCVTISRLCCVDADGFDLTRRVAHRGWPPK